MFGLGPATKIYIAVEAVDMRKGFDGLYGLVRDRLGEDPLSGHLFLFANRARSRLKVLVWDGSGLWVCAKRLEKGPVPLAGGKGRTVPGDAAGRVGNAGEWAWIWPMHGRARTGCGRRRQHKTFLRICVRKRLAITRYLTYNRTYSWLPSILKRASSPWNAS